MKRHTALDMVFLSRWLTGDGCCCLIHTRGASLRLMCSKPQFDESHRSIVAYVRHRTARVMTQVIIMSTKTALIAYSFILCSRTLTTLCMDGTLCVKFVVKLLPYSNEKIAVHSNSEATDGQVLHTPLHQPTHCNHLSSLKSTNIHTSSLSAQ